MKQKTKMNIKNLMVSFVVLAGILLLTATASAVTPLPYTDNGFTVTQVTVDGADASNDDVALIAGETVTLKVYFTMGVGETQSDIKVKAELEGSNVDAQAVTEAFGVVENHSYVKVFTLKVPNNFDEVSDDATLSIDFIGGSTFAPAVFNVLVQKASYDVEFALVSTSDTIEAGKVFPVEFVLKNIGYNDLEDVYVTVSIPELGVQKQGYFGDIVSVDNVNVDNNKNDVVSGKILLDIPYTAKSGDYKLLVSAKNNDFETSMVRQIAVGNGLSSNVFVTGNKIVIANPTTQLMVLKLVPESTGSVTLSEELVVVPAGASKTITASATGDYTVNVFSKDGKLLESVTVPASIQTGSAGNAVAVLTVILTVVFLVLLVVLIVLITKKPEKTEEFSESYY